MWPIFGSNLFDILGIDIIIMFFVKAIYVLHLLRLLRACSSFLAAGIYTGTRV